MTPSIALLLSVATILILLRLKLHPGPAILIGGLVLSLLIMPVLETPRQVVRTVIDLQTWRLVGIFLLAFVLSKLMEVRGMLTRLARTLESIGPRMAMHVVPSVIGMVPMPGGAVVSATAMKGLADRLRLLPAQSTYINFWFRHMWELAIPVYPSVIAASVVLGLPLSTVVLTMLPVIPLMSLCGGFVSYRILRQAPPAASQDATRSQLAQQLVRASWPVLLLVAMVLAGVEAVVSFLLVTVLVAMQQRVTRRELQAAVRYALDGRILILLFSVMIYKDIVEASGSAYSLFTDMQATGVPPALILIALPLLMGFASGLSMAFVGIAFPLLLPYLLSADGLNGYALFLAYVAGGLGYMVSPLHLCLILSAEFFRARLGDVYRIMAPPLLAVLGVALLAFLLL